MLTACRGDVTETPKAKHTPTVKSAKTTTSPSPSRTFVPNTPPWEDLPTTTPTPFSKLGLEDDDLRGTSIDYWYVGSPSDVVGLLVDQFNSSNVWGIKVSARAFPGYGEMSETLFAGTSGTMPDLLTTYNYQAAQLDEDGSTLVDINLYLQDPIWGMSTEEQEDFYTSFWTQDVDPYTGKRLGLPFDRSALVLFYNATWGEELGFERPPVTPQEFSEQACAAAEENNFDGFRDNDGTGGWVISNDPSALTAWLLAFDSSLLDRNGKYDYQTDESTDAMEFLAELGIDGCAWNSDNQSVYDAFAERKALFISAQSMAIANQKQVMREYENDDEWQVLPYPGVSGTPLIVTRGPALSIVKSSPERQLAAWILTTWLSEPKNQAHRVDANSGFPIRQSENDHLQKYIQANPQWLQAFELLPYARSEPSIASWSMMRWAQTDALNQLYLPNFNFTDVPVILKLLDQLAIEASVQYP